MDASMVSQLKELQAENRRLKKMYADAQLSADLLKDLHSPLVSRSLDARYGRIMWGKNGEKESANPSESSCAVVLESRQAADFSVNRSRGVRCWIDALVPGPGIEPG